MALTFLRKPKLETMLDRLTHDADKNLARASLIYNRYKPVWTKC